MSVGRSRAGGPEQRSIQVKMTTLEGTDGRTEGVGRTNPAKWIPTNGFPFPLLSRLKLRKGGSVQSARAGELVI